MPPSWNRPPIDTLVIIIQANQSVEALNHRPPRAIIILYLIAKQPVGELIAKGGAGEEGEPDGALVCELSKWIEHEDDDDYDREQETYSEDRFLLSVGQQGNRGIKVTWWSVSLNLLVCVVSVFLFLRSS